MRIIETSAAPSHNGPVPQAVEAGGWIYVSALFGADPETHAIPADARAEAERLFANLAAILEAAGARCSVISHGSMLSADAPEGPQLLLLGRSFVIAESFEAEPISPPP